MDEIYNFIFDDIKSRLDDSSVIYTLHDKRESFDPIPSDIAVVDDMLCGGLPEGRIIEIFGPEASGKTTLTLHFIAAAQKLGYIVYFIDAEQALDMAYAQRIGVNPNTLLFSQPDYGEQALETARAICESTEAAKDQFKETVRSLIVIDSVPALVPKAAFDTYEKDGYDAKTALGLQASMLARLLPPLVNKAGKSGVTVVFINQERDKINVSYGSTTTTPGGRALKFFSSLRLKVNRIGYFERGGQRSGIRTQVVPVKSKLFPIFDKSSEIIITGNGVDQSAALCELLLKKKILTKKGAWIKYGDESFQGIIKVEERMNADIVFRRELMAKLYPDKAENDVIEEKPQDDVKHVLPLGSEIVNRGIQVGNQNG